MCNRQAAGDSAVTYCWSVLMGTLRRADWGAAPSDRGPADPGPGWRPGGVSPVCRAVPAPPAAALLSHPRVRSRRG